MTVSMKMTGLVLTGSYVRTTDIDPNSHLDRNKLKPKDGSVPFPDVRNTCIKCGECLAKISEE